MNILFRRKRFNNTDVMLYLVKASILMTKQDVMVILTNLSAK